MKTLECPRCRGKITVSIGPLRPMEAVSADMLEQGVTFQCSNCSLYSTNTFDIRCPQCGRKSLSASIDRKQIANGVDVKKRRGKIGCKLCGWVQKIG